ncbi:MAG: amidophosphoribosyltransferase, partial [Clostridia bacterium]
AKYIRDVEPGEIVIISDKGLESTLYSEFKHHYMCAMEYIYFARPDSDIENCNVHAFRKESGKLLARCDDVDADICIGVPDSSISCAIGYAEEKKIPYEIGLIKNKYVGRTFIAPSQELREKGVRMKLSAVHSIVEGKNVVMVDDSIVRGTTSKRIVNMLKEAGAKSVHVRIGSPEFKNPCFYGVDTTSYEELISARLDVEGVRKEIGADSLKYLSVEDLYKAGKRAELCVACFDGHYPTDIYSSFEEANKDGKF